MELANELVSAAGKGWGHGVIIGIILMLIFGRRGKKGKKS